MATGARCLEVWPAWLPNHTPFPSRRQPLRCGKWLEIQWARARHCNYRQVAALHEVPLAQAPSAGQDNWQLDPAQATSSWQEYLPVHRTTLVPAKVVTPPAHERAPLHVISHWSPEHFTNEPQLACPSQVIFVTDAVLTMPPPQSLAEPQVIWHCVPAHNKAPAQESP
jgi:hypothetical protein